MANYTNSAILCGPHKSLNEKTNGYFVNPHLFWGSVPKNREVYENIPSRVRDTCLYRFSHLHNSCFFLNPGAAEAVNKSGTEFSDSDPDGNLYSAGNDHISPTVWHF